MSFVRWHYRNGCYVRSHFRRARRTVAGNGALPLFPPTCSDEVTGKRRHGHLTLARGSARVREAR